jgi:hypothetical protein
MGGGSETDCACAPKTDNSRQIARGRCFMCSNGVALTTELAAMHGGKRMRPKECDFLSFSETVVAVAELSARSHKVVYRARNCPKMPFYKLF